MIAIVGMSGIGTRKRCRKVLGRIGSIQKKVKSGDPAPRPVPHATLALGPEAKSSSSAQAARRTGLAAR